MNTNSGSALPPDAGDGTTANEVKPVTLKLRGPVDVIASVPYLLGFHPTDSLVAIGIGSPEGTAVVRIDLPPVGADSGIDQISDHIAEMLSTHNCATAVLVGYGSREATEPLIVSATHALETRGVAVSASLRVDGDRWWAIHDPEDCPPEGWQYDISGSIIPAQAAYAGVAPLRSRTELAHSVAPLTGPSRLEMQRATERAEEKWTTRRAGCDDAGEFERQMVLDAVPLIEDLYARALDGGVQPSPDEVAELGLLLTNLRIRDEAWVRMDADRLDAYIEFWRTVLRGVQPGYAAAPGSLLAYVAYASGHGTLANVALDRAEDASPGYSMASLLRAIVRVGMPPSQIVLRYTPEELAAESERRD